MKSELRSAVVSFTMPGGLVVLGGAVLLWTGILPVHAYGALGFYLFTLIVTGALLAWRFYSSRALYALAIVALADGMVWWLGNAHHLPIRVRETGADVVAILLPLNFAAIVRWRKRGFSLTSITHKSTFLLVQVALVGMLCRPEQVLDMEWLRYHLLPGPALAWTGLPQPAILAWAGAFGVIAVSWWTQQRRPLEKAWFWALTACMLGARLEVAPGVATFYFSVAALVLVLALIDNSYLLAYHDELTGIPARRAFNEAVSQLQDPYVIAMVDVDHFKSFNDTFGHETGDQVLRMVASKLSRVGGGGRSYRCGGEEFGIVFPDKTAEEVLPHVEAVRRAIEQTRFTIRGPDRSRRKRPERRYHPAERRGQPARTVSVTASFGVAESDPSLATMSDVINAADQALYRAKDAGRNRVEVWASRATRRTATRLVGRR